MFTTNALNHIRDDYVNLLAELGLTEAQAQKSSSDLSDHIGQPRLDFANFTYGKSQIRGNGTFAAKLLVAGQYIGALNINGCRTMLGRSVNHSPMPNARADMEGNVLVLSAAGPIPAGEEITVNYRFMPAIKLALSLRK